MDWEKAFGNLEALNWVILLLLGSASYWLMSETFTTGVILGGLMTIANFHALQYTIRRGFASSGVFQAKKASIIGKYYARFMAMGVLIYFLITRQWVHPVGLVIGLSAVVISIVIFGIHMVCKTPCREAT